MEITEVRIFPTESKDGKLKAFATMTFDDWFVVRNVKVIQGNNGLFVAMPSRKAMSSCPKCRSKNVVGSKYCNQCGSQLSQQASSSDSADETHNSHMDIAHPITQECRVYIQEQILAAYNKDIAQSSKAESESERQGKGARQVTSEDKKEETSSQSTANSSTDTATEKLSAGKSGQGAETINVEDEKDIEL